MVLEKLSEEASLLCTASASELALAVASEVSR